MRAIFRRGYCCALALLISAFACLSIPQTSRADLLVLQPGYPSPITFQMYSMEMTITPNADPFSTGTLNGQPLNSIFCVDLFDGITPSTPYDLTTVTNNGVVNGALVNNAGGIAWLIDNFASSTTADSDQWLGLQAAIWYLEYQGSPYDFSLDGASVAGSSTTSATYSAYQYYLTQYANARSPTASLATIDWISPGSSGTPGDYYQGLAAPNSVVPEPGSLILLGLGMTGVIPLAFFRRKLALSN
jgi:PEP-CTERM motif